MKEERYKSLNDEDIRSAEWNTQLTQLHEIHGLKIETERRRWLILFAFSLLNFSNSVASSLYSLNVDEIEDYYKIGRFNFLQLSNIFYYIYIFLSIPFSTYITDHFGVCMMISTTFNTLGGFIRWYGGNNYGMALTAQAFAGIAQSCILQVPAVITEEWFATHERMWALIIATFSGYFGWAVGNLAPCYYFEYYSTPVGFDMMHSHQLIIVVIPTLILPMVLQNRPKNYPNLGTYIKRRAPRKPLREVMVDLFKNRDYVSNMLCIGFATGVSYTIPTITAFILDRKNYSNLNQGYIGGAFLITGICGALIGTIYLQVKKINNYDSILKLCFLVGFFSIIGLGFMKDQSRLWLFLMMNGIAGIGYISFSPFAIESLLETSFPHPESLSIGNSIIVAQIFSLILIHFTTLRSIGDQGFWVLAAAALPATFFMLFKFKTVFRRSILEIEESEKSDEPLLYSENASPLLINC